MAETHELRLRINAAAAKAGSREFVSAINAMARAVKNLDRDSDGAFKRLKAKVQDASKAKVKVDLIDKGALTRLSNYAKAQSDALRATSATSRSISNLATQVRSMADAYNIANTAGNNFINTVVRTNAALARQVVLASQAGAAFRTVGTPTGSVSGGGGGAGGGTASRAAEQQVAIQNRATRAVDDTRLAVERLTTQLMKVGGFSSIQKVGEAFRRFQREVSDTSLSARELDNAKTRLNSTLKRAQTSLITLTAKEQEQARAQKAASAAAREHAAASNALAAAARAEAAAVNESTRASAKNQAVQLSASAAIRQAEQATATLTNRLRSIGDTSGITAINQALMNLKAQLSSGVASTLQIRQAMDQFANAANTAKIAVTQAAGAQQRASASARELARQEHEASIATRRLEAEMRSAAGASNAASAAFRNATGGLRGLENAFSASFQIGSAFRTLIGSITLGTFTKSVFRAGDALQQFSITMEVASGSAKAAAKEISFIDELARTLGVNLRGAREDFAKFAVSSSIAGVSADGTRKIFESVATAMAVLGKGAEDQRLAFLALEQMMSKGVISSEELRRQLGERLPGAVNLMARAIGVSTGELQKLLKAGALVSADVLPKFAAELDRTFGSQLERTFNRAGSNLGRLQVEFEKFLEAIANSGFLDTLSEEFKDLTSLMRSSGAQEAARALGEGFSEAARQVGAAAQFIIENINEIGEVAKAVIGALLIRQVALLARSVTFAGQNMLAMVSSMVGVSAGAQQMAAGIDRTTGSIVAQSTALNNFNKTATGTLGTIGTMGRVLGGLGRVFGALAGPVGLAFSAITLVPLVLDDVGVAVDEAARKYDDAMRRMGTSSFHFIDTAREVEKATKFEELVENLSALDEARVKIENFANSADLTAGIQKDLEGIKANTPIDAVKAAADEIEKMIARLRETAMTGKDVEKQIEAIKTKISEMRAITQDRGIWEFLKSLGENLDPLGQAIVTANALLARNKEIAGDSAKAFENLDAKAKMLTASINALSAGADNVNNLSESVRSLLEQNPEGLIGVLDNLRIGMGAIPVAGAAMRQSLENLLDTFDGTSASATMVSGKLTEMRAELTKIANDKGASEQTKDTANSMIDQIDAAQELIDELRNLQAALNGTAAAQASVGASIERTIGTMDSAIDKALAYVGILDQINSAGEAAKKTAEEYRKELEIEVKSSGLTGLEKKIFDDLTTGDTAKQLKEIDASIDSIKTSIQSVGEASFGGLDKEEMLSRLADLQKTRQEIVKIGEEAQRTIFANEEANKKTRSRGRREKKTEDEKDLDRLIKRTVEYRRELQEETAALLLVAQGRRESAEAAELEVRMKLLGIDTSNKAVQAYLSEVESAEQLRDALERMANDPVKDWIDSVPTWREAGRMIEVDVIETLSGAISQFIQTGKLDFESLGASILGTITDIMADKAMKEFLNLIGMPGGFDLGGLLSGTFSSVGDPVDPIAGTVAGAAEAEAMLVAFTTGGLEAAAAIRAALMEGAAAISSSISSGGATAGATMSTSMATGGTTASAAVTTGMTVGGTTAATTIGTGVTTSGATAASGMGSAIVAGGSAAAAQMGAAVAAGGAGGGIPGVGGAGGGGFFSGISNLFTNIGQPDGLFGTLFSFFKEGGTTNSPAVQTGIAPLAMFRDAPHYATGTPNTSGMPAMLHENEAVVPLTRGRKIPVDLGDMEDGRRGGGKTLNQSFYITTPDADSFRESQSQVLASAAAAGQRALSKNG